MKKTYYELGSELPNIISGFIAFEEGVKNTVTFKLGELGFDMKNYPSDIDVILNSKGELEIILDTGDANSYSINANGDLIYTPVS